jgi:hypothetical protein
MTSGDPKEMSGGSARLLLCRREATETLREERDE